MSQTLQLQQNPMRQIKIGKLVLNIGLGKSGEAIERGKKVLEQITGQKVCQRKARKTIRDFGIHRGEPIAVLVTVRGKRAEEILEKLLEARDKRLSTSCFDENGSISFGIKEHIEIPGIKYDPSIGILGMNVSILLEKPGYRVARRLRKRSKIGIRQRVSREEAIKFLSERFGAIVE
jgi:large subunit ribosomal protein L5